MERWETKATFIYRNSLSFGFSHLPIQWENCKIRIEMNFKWTAQLDEQNELKKQKTSKHDNSVNNSW